jgi:LPS export ABC transporter protein LptC
MIRITFLGLLLLLFSACSNASKQVEKVSNSMVQYPLNEQIDAQITYSDSGQKVLEIQAGLVQDFGNLDPAYVYFGNRVKVQFYNGKTLTSTVLEADTARQLKDEDLWAIGGNVILTNGKGERMTTEQMFWDKKEERLYSTSKVQILSDGQLITGKGFEADQEFNKYRIFKVQGEITIKDE